MEDEAILRGLKEFEPGFPYRDGGWEYGFTELVTRKGMTPDVPPERVASVRVRRETLCGELDGVRNDVRFNAVPYLPVGQLRGRTATPLEIQPLDPQYIFKPFCMSSNEGLERFMERTMNTLRHPAATRELKEYPFNYVPQADIPQDETDFRLVARPDEVKGMMRQPKVMMISLFVCYGIGLEGRKMVYSLPMGEVELEKVAAYMGEQLADVYPESEFLSQTGVYEAYYDLQERWTEKELISAQEKDVPSWSICPAGVYSMSVLLWNNEALL